LHFAVLWWGSYGGLAYELQSLAKRIISLCCAASGCERNWSAFAHVSYCYFLLLAVIGDNILWAFVSAVFFCVGPYQKEKPVGA
jgi:hypothetical protein